MASILDKLKKVANDVTSNPEQLVTAGIDPTTWGAWKALEASGVDMPTPVELPPPYCRARCFISATAEISAKRPSFSCLLI